MARLGDLSPLEISERIRRDVQETYSNPYQTTEDYNAVRLGEQQQRQAALDIQKQQQAAIEEQEAKKQKAIDAAGFAGALGRGYTQAKGEMKIGILGHRDLELAKDYVESTQQKTTAQKEFLQAIREQSERFDKAKGFFPTLGAALGYVPETLGNLKGALLETTEQLPRQVPALAAGGLAGKAVQLGVRGAAAAGGLSLLQNLGAKIAFQAVEGAASAGTEYGAEFTNNLLKYVKDPNNQEELAAIFDDPEIRARAHELAVQKGFGVGSAEGVTGLLTSLISSSLGRKGGALVTGLGEWVAEPVGEYTGQKFQGVENVDTTEVALEAILAGPQVAGATLIDYSLGNKKGVAEKTLEGLQKNYKEQLIANARVAQKKGPDGKVIAQGDINPVTQQEFNNKELAPFWNKVMNLADAHQQWMTRAGLQRRDGKLYRQDQDGNFTVPVENEQVNATDEAFNGAYDQLTKDLVTKVSIPTPKVQSEGDVLSKRKASWRDKKVAEQYLADNPDSGTLEEVKSKTGKTTSYVIKKDGNIIDVTVPFTSKGMAEKAIGNENYPGTKAETHEAVKIGDKQWVIRPKEKVGPESIVADPEAADLLAYLSRFLGRPITFNREEATGKPTEGAEATPGEGTTTTTETPSEAPTTQEEAAQAAPDTQETVAPDGQTTTTTEADTTVEVVNPIPEGMTEEEYLATQGLPGEESTPTQPAPKSKKLGEQVEDVINNLIATNPNGEFRLSEVRLAFKPGQRGAVSKAINAILKRPNSDIIAIADKQGIYGKRTTAVPPEGFVATIPEAPPSQAPSPLARPAPTATTPTAPTEAPEVNIKQLQIGIEDTDPTVLSQLPDIIPTLEGKDKERILNTLEKEINKLTALVKSGEKETNPNAMRKAYLQAQRDKLQAYLATREAIDQVAPVEEAAEPPQVEPPAVAEEEATLSEEDLKNIDTFSRLAAAKDYNLYNDLTPAQIFEEAKYKDIIKTGIESRKDDPLFDEEAYFEEWERARGDYFKNLANRKPKTPAGTSTDVDFNAEQKAKLTQLQKEVRDIYVPLAARESGFVPKGSKLYAWLTGQERYGLKKKTYPSNGELIGQLASAERRLQLALTEENPSEKKIASIQSTIKSLKEDLKHAGQTGYEIIRSNLRQADTTITNALAKLEQESPAPNVPPKDTNDRVVNNQEDPSSEGQASLAENYIGAVRTQDTEKGKAGSIISHRHTPARKNLIVKAYRAFIKNFQMPDGIRWQILDSPLELSNKWIADKTERAKAIHDGKTTEVEQDLAGSLHAYIQNRGKSPRAFVITSKVDGQKHVYFFTSLTKDPFQAISMALHEMMTHSGMVKTLDNIGEKGRFSKKLERLLINSNRKLFDRIIAYNKAGGYNFDIHLPYAVGRVNGQVTRLLDPTIETIKVHGATYNKAELLKLAEEFIARESENMLELIGQENVSNIFMNLVGLQVRHLVRSFGIQNANMKDIYTLLGRNYYAHMNINPSAMLDDIYAQYQYPHEQLLLEGKGKPLENGLIFAAVNAGSPPDEGDINASLAVGESGKQVALHDIARDTNKRLGRPAKSNLYYAKSMINRGVHPEEVFNETGWYKLPDGGWRYILPLNNLRYNVDGLIDVRTKLSMGNPIDEYNRERDRRFNLKDIIEWPELYKVYPQLRELPIDLHTIKGDDVGYNGSAYYSKKASKIQLAIPENQINNLTLRNNEFMSILVHELQHIIQGIEGWERGASHGELSEKLGKKAGMQNYYLSLGEIEARISEQMTDWYWQDTPDAALTGRLPLLQEPIARDILLREFYPNAEVFQELPESAIMHTRINRGQDTLTAANPREQYLNKQFPQGYTAQDESVIQASTSNIEGMQAAINNTYDSFGIDPQLSEIMAMASATSRGVPGSVGTPFEIDLRLTAGTNEFFKNILNNYGKTKAETADTWQNKIVRKMRNNKYAERIRSLAGLPTPELYKALDGRLKGVIEQVETLSTTIYKSLHKLPAATKKKVIEAATTPGFNWDDPANRDIKRFQPLITKARKVVDQAGAIAVDLNGLSKETYEKNKGEYLPTMYWKYIDEYLGTGKKTSGLHWMMKRMDMSTEERARFGEVLAPEYVLPTAVAVLGRDVLLLQYYKAIRDTNEQLANSWILDANIKIPYINDHGKRVEADVTTIDEDIVRYREILSDTTGSRFAQQPQERVVVEEALKNALEAKAKSEEIITQRVVDLMKRAGVEGEVNDKLIERYKSENYKRMPKSKRYGVLSNQLVHKAIFDDIVDLHDEFNEENMSWFNKLFSSQGTFGKMTQQWKAFKTIWNPPTHAGNVGSNFILMDASTSTPTWKLMQMINEEVRAHIKGTPTKYAIEAHKRGLFGTTFSNSELYSIRNHVSDEIKQAVAKDVDPSVVKGFKAFFHSKFMAVQEWAGHIYGLEEGLMKTVKFRDEVEQWEKQNNRKVESLTDDQKEAVFTEAALAAQSTLFDYSSVPKWLKEMRQNPLTGAPFITFLYKVVPQLAINSLRHPAKTMKYLMLPYFIAYAAWGMSDFDDDEKEKILASMPKWAKDNASFNIIPLPPDKDGNFQFWDLSRFTPWGQIANLGSKILSALDNPVGLEALGPLASAPQELGLFGGPFMNMATAYMTNKDPFTQREIQTPGATRWTNAEEIMTYLHGMWAPNIITHQGFAGKLLDHYGIDAPILSTGRELDPLGNERSTFLANVLPRVAGVNVYRQNTRAGIKANLAQYDRQIREIQQARFKIQRDKNNPEDKAVKLKAQNDLLRAVQERRMEFLREALGSKQQ